MWLLERFDDAILGIWFDGLMFDIGMTFLLPYFYYFQSTGRSGTDQIAVTCG